MPVPIPAKDFHRARRRRILASDPTPEDPSGGRPRDEHHDDLQAEHQDELAAADLRRVERGRRAHREEGDETETGEADDPRAQEAPADRATDRTRQHRGEAPDDAERGNRPRVKQAFWLGIVVVRVRMPPEIRRERPRQGERDGDGEQREPHQSRSGKHASAHRFGIVHSARSASVGSTCEARRAGT